MNFRLGELFCGAGGIASGAKLASLSLEALGVGIEHVWATDNDQDACKTFRNNILKEDPASVIESDIGVPNLFEELSGISDIDALAFGFPCNDFSSVGTQQGTNGNFGPLYSYAIKALESFNPRWFLAENVRGLRNANEGQAFQNILHEMRNAGLGYDVVPHLYKFEKYGVPQARHRIIIVGIRKDEKRQFKIPSPYPFRDDDVSCSSAILNPPLGNDALNNELTTQSKTVIERLQHINPGENAFTANLPLHLKLNVKGATLSQIYKRLTFSKPAYTVTGSGGGGTHVYHWREDRALTNRERARLQTFEDTFGFSGNKESVRRQIGMAVPPRGAKVIFEAILKTFADKEYEYVSSNIDSVHPLLETGVGQSAS